MKKIIYMLMLNVIIGNSYSIEYRGIKLGEIKNFETINKGYLIGESVGGLIRSIVPFDNYIIYEKNKPEKKGKNKYKKDNNMILEIVRIVTKEKPELKIIKKNNKVLTIKCKNDKCKYERKNKNNMSKGFINLKNNKLEEICDEKSKVCIKIID
jgi:hypothetical protein